MNKFIKCWVFIICLLFIFLILFTDRVNGAELYPHYISNGELSNNIININTSNDMYEHVMNLNSDQLISWGNYKMLKGTYAYINQTGTITTNTSININQINWSQTGSSLQCSNITSQAGNESYVGTIHYADGTSATIDWKTRTYLCDLYSYSASTGTGNGVGSSVSNQPNIDNNPYIIIYTRYNNSINGICKVDYTGWFECEKTGSTNNINNFVFNITKRTSNIDNAKVMLFRMIYFYNSDVSTLHTDNQTIIQQQQDINNSITSDNVTGNNSNSSITTIGNTFNTEGDFLLNLLTIPYNLWTSIINAIGGTCSPIDVGTIFGEHLVFPCINLNSLLGGVWTTIIDVIFTGMIYSAFIRRVIKYFRELLTLDPQALETGGVKIW